MLIATPDGIILLLPCAEGWTSLLSRLAREPSRGIAGDESAVCVVEGVDVMGVAMLWSVPEGRELLDRLTSAGPMPPVVPGAVAAEFVAPAAAEGCCCDDDKDVEMSCMLSFRKIAPTTRVA